MYSHGLLPLGRPTWDFQRTHGYNSKTEDGGLRLDQVQFGTCPFQDTGCCTFVHVIFSTVEVVFDKSTFYEYNFATLQ